MMEPITVRVLLFGQLAEVMGDSAVVLSAPAGSTCADLRLQISREAPALAPYLKSCRLAVNHQFAADDQPIGSSDEVALIGLVCGG